MIDINTTRNPSGDMRTTTSGMGSNQAGLGGLFADLIRRRLQAQAAPANGIASPRLGRSQETEAPQFEGPSMGAAPVQPKATKMVTRTVIDPQANPYTKMATGFDPQQKVERGFRRSDGSIQWEFEDLRPHGGSGGIQGGGAESTLHATPDLSTDARAAQRDDYNPATGLRRERAPIAPSTNNRNNDSRGEGFGMDYGRGVKGRGAR